MVLDLSWQVEPTEPTEPTEPAEPAEPVEPLAAEAPSPALVVPEVLERSASEIFQLDQKGQQ